MNGDHEPTGRANTRASRRQFFRMLAASPALALAYPALSPVWQREVDRELARTRATRAVCADCGQEFHLAPMEPMRSKIDSGWCAICRLCAEIFSIATSCWPPGIP